MAASLFAASLGAEELSLRDTPGGRMFGTGEFAVRLDPATGWPGAVFCDGRCVIESAGTGQVFDIKQGDAWLTGSGTPIEGSGVDRIGPDALRVRLKAGGWTVAACVQLFPQQRMLRRWFELTWNESPDCKIKGFWFQGGRIPLPPAGSYFCPAKYPPKRIPGCDLIAGRKMSSDRSPHPVIADRGDGWSAVWMLDELPGYADRGNSTVTEEDGAIQLTQSFQVQGHARKGVAQKVGDAWLWLQPNGGETALQRLPEWFRKVNQVPPPDRPEWLKRVILYSFHPGGTIGSQCRDLGGFRPATDLLTHIRQLGCNAIWLLPLEDKSIYWPRDYYRFQEGLGTPEDYQALTARARQLGLRVWQDCVPHGGGNQFPRAKEHPEWLAQNEDGSTLDYWCFDFNWPTWIDYMRGVTSHYTQTYGLDGFRIDACGGSKIPNWNPAIPYARASHAQAQGGLAMQRAIRQAVKSIRPDGATLAEVGASIHGSVSDSTYDFSLCYEVLHDFRKTPAEVFVPRLRRWLHEQQWSEIPDLVRMRHLESHDSLRSGLWYGAEPQRALLALISWIHGIPMVYHEMEDGNFADFRRIFHVRDHVPELNAGAADYLSATAPPGVFACLRTGSVPEKGSPAWHASYAWDQTPSTPARASLVLVNLGTRTAGGEVSLPLVCLPESLRQASGARNLLSGEVLPLRRAADGSCIVTVSLAPFAYTVLRFESRPLPELPSLPAAPAPATKTSPPAVSPLELTANGRTWRIDPPSGMASVWREDGREPLATLDLALPASLARAAAPAICRRDGNAVDVRRVFGTHTLHLRYTPSAEGQVQIHAQWEGGVPPDAALVLAASHAARWQAATAEGMFASPFRVRHPQCDGVTGSIYRRPQGTATFWDSRLHPFGLSRDQAWVAAIPASGSTDGTVLTFDPERLPGSVQLLDRAGASLGLKILLAWQNRESGVTWGAPELRFAWAGDIPVAPASVTAGDPRLRIAGGGWEFENAHLRVRIARTGALAELWDRQDSGWRQLLHQGSIYTDRGFGDDKTRYAQENDVETAVRLERRGSALCLSFCGELRGFGRFDKLPRPIRFYTRYVLDDAPAFRFSSAVQPGPGTPAGSAYLALLLRTNGLDHGTFADAKGDYLTGQRKDGRERYAQLARSPEPARLPTDLRLSGPGNATLRLSGLTWAGGRPANVFLHGEDLHLAWMDGDAGNARLMQKWSGIDGSLGVSGAAAAGDEPLPLPAAQAPGLLRDGDFALTGLRDRVLVSTGGKLSQESDGRDAWVLPPGAAYAEEGGNPCVRVPGDGQSYRLIRQHLPAEIFKPGAQWLLRARMKGVNIEAGDVGWKAASLRWAVTCEGRTAYTTVSLPTGNHPWQTREVAWTVPEGIEQLAIEAGMNGNKGEVWIDDVKIVNLASPP